MTVPRLLVVSRLLGCPGVLRPIIRLIVVTITICLAGCASDSIEQDYDEYLTRLARVLDQDPSDWKKSVLMGLKPIYPSAKGRRLLVSDTRVGVFDFLALHDCELMQLISERNTSLGRVMSETARFHYEVMILSGIRRCLAELDDDPELEEALQQIRDIKQVELSRHWWNATWGSDAFDRFFALSQPTLSKKAVSGYETPAIVSLERYLLLLNEHVTGTQSSQATSYLDVASEAERALKDLEFHYGGRLIKSVSMGAGAINEANRLLRTRLESRPICINQKPSRQAEILRNVLTKYYVLSFQPHLSALDKEMSQLVRPLSSLNARFSELGTPAVRGFYGAHLDVNQSYFPQHQLKRALQEHAELWSDLFASCGMQIGGMN
ncbi:MAG: DUF3080 domain-containing protein [Pseudomonadales bacterium]|nr:DUF3080 domain-containing protein [Pseudomonadales bacterium]